ncbi:MAG: RagB/SusD family nutrient uptake outer membrane protein [Tannerellaceae bacterium]|nr:RagB/SusD family nutrient uptake outer membrane protein [Tannerellaceae bacterium]
MRTFTIHTLIYPVFVFFLTACDSFLTLSPDDALPAGSAIVDASTAQAAMYGAYSALQSYYKSDYVTLGVMPADNVSYNGTLSQYLQLDQNAIPTDNVVTVDAYKALYKAINSANSILASIDDIEDPLLTTELRNEITGTAYFVRALAYFDLARGWGGVQIQLQPTLDLSVISGIKRSTLTATYDQVLDDLKKAEGYLADDAATRNKVQQSTVYALRARLHLYREEWEEAEEYATKVITNSKYSLVKPYSTFFTSPFLSEESVFELTYDTNNRNTYWNLWYPSSYGGQYTLKPSDTIIEKLNDPAAGGTRKALIEGSGNSVYGVLYNTISSGTDPSYVIRIAELYLIRAEARVKKTSPDLSGALADLNAVRTRAEVPLLQSNSRSEIILAIEEERSIEFAFEPHRWFDLVRTGRVGEVLGVTNRNFWLFPFPQSDVLSDPDLNQNPGY